MIFLPPLCSCWWAAEMTKEWLVTPWICGHTALIFISQFVTWAYPLIKDFIAKIMKGHKSVYVHLNVVLHNLKESDAHHEGGICSAASHYTNPHECLILSVSLSGPCLLSGNNCKPFFKYKCKRGKNNQQWRGITTMFSHEVGCLIWNNENAARPIKCFLKV